jgi:large subunit ribosomal protein L24
MRGEYKGVEGKVEEVITHSGSLLIEGVQREKIRGGNVRVPIHASNVMLINLNLDDRQRSARLRGVSKSSEEEPDRSKTGAKDEEKSKQEASA